MPRSWQRTSRSKSRFDLKIIFQAASRELKEPIWMRALLMVTRSFRDGWYLFLSRISMSNRTGASLGDLIFLTVPMICRLVNAGFKP